ncbi:hypothetical protein A6J46_13490 [Neisseria gonorrhoeae]|nr:hypothetical protein A6J46_13490 [Neisseria gonorrhoeae]
MDKEVDYEDLGLILTPGQLAVLEADDGAEPAGDTDADGEKAPDAGDAAGAPGGGEPETSESDAGAAEGGSDGGVPDGVRTRSSVPRTANTLSLMKSW